MVLLVCILYIPYFYIAVIITEIVVILSLISKNDNPDYKIPWLIVVLVIPVVGFMLYFLFYNRKLNKKYINKVYDLKNAKKYIFIEYFIIEEGLFWNIILNILIEKAKNRIEDMINTINNSEEIVSVKNSLLNRLIVVLIKIFSPLL